MIKFISCLVVLILSIVCICLSIKMFKSSKTIIEKILYLLLLFIYFVPIIIYLLDRYDIPSKIGYTNSVDISRWFDFISSYISTIVGTIVSGVILVLITIKQINIQIESNNNDKRLQNSPILDYSLKIANNSKYDYYHNVKLKENGKEYHIYLKVENIGLNHCRNLNFKIIVDNENDPEFSLNKEQSFLRKDNSVVLDLIFNLDYKKRNERSLTIIITYEDMLNNRYEQIIKSKLLYNDKDEYGKKINVGELVIEKEKILNK